MIFPEQFKDLDTQKYLVFLDISELNHRKNSHNSRLFLDYADQKYLATKGLHPYGERTEDSLKLTNTRKTASNSNLLQILLQKEDYSIFDVPKSLLSVINATLGSNPYHSETVDNVYQEMGSILSQTILGGYKMNEIGLSDFGLNIDNGNIVFIPPFKFRKGESNIERIKDNLSKTINNSFRSVLSDRRVEELTIFIIEGIDNELRDN